MKNTNLKVATFFTPQTSDVHFERYVVENNEDLEAFFKAFSHNRKMMQNTLKKSLTEGRTILLTDSTLSGFTSYSYETKVDDVNKLEGVHPSSFIRVVEVVEIV
jgi:ribosome biogenesis GTPase A